MASGKKQQYSDIEAFPVKSFFVNMLTRDIRLEDAILDLLDNCVDGILRNDKPKATAKKPYEGYYAELTFKKDSFEIHDNCGGIPWNLHDYAFRMGRDNNRAPDVAGTVGVYGIGMKRAIFKIGREALISTQNGDHTYDVEISSDWLEDEENWKLPVVAGKKTSDDGTTICVEKLYKDISELFSEESFRTDLEKIISTQYAFIIDKGFEIKINKKTVKPRATRLVYSKKNVGKGSEVRPFIWKTSKDGVDVHLSVGFSRPLPTIAEIEGEQEETHYSSLQAGWTVICNDRAVLYCDRTELTGWGEAGVPRYHTQFIAISGVVEFKSKDPSKLPTTTTKRGIDASSRLFLQVKNKMREGTKLFTNYTNKWKDQIEDSKEYIESEEALSISEIKEQKVAFTKTKGSLDGYQYIPKLPMPKGKELRSRKISYSKDLADIKTVSNYLFEDAEQEPSVVGEKCFDLMLKEAKR